MGVGRAQFKGWSAAPPKTRTEESVIASDKDKGASGEVMFPAEQAFFVS